MSKDKKGETQTAQAKSYTISEIIKDPVQMVIFCLIFVTLVAGIVFSVDGYYIRKDGLANAPPGYEYPQFSDAWITFVSAAVMYIFDVYLLRPVFKPLGNMICKEQDDLEL